ncbi:unnamed protein product [Gordionus sp. m RMFG-2023]|uniref:heat shock protein 27-like n=1 Tax=Gordionus sp. m RMFG-2023 TaxID=3053472 RepID=UPI0030E2C854
MSEYRGDISIPVRNESRSYWSSEGRSLKDKFAEERRKMEAEMENLKQKFHFSKDRPASSIERSNFDNSRDYQSSSYYDQSSSSNRDNYSNRSPQRYDTSYYPENTYRQQTASSTLAPYQPTGSIQGFGNQPAGPIQGFGKSPEWRYVETGPDGRKLVKLQFDMINYQPNEIQVLVDNDFLKIRAKHEEGGPNRSCYREYNREFTLPSVIRSNQIISHLSRDGILTVEAPLPQDFDYRRNDMGFDLKVPIEYRQ